MNSDRFNAGVISGRSIVSLKVLPDESNDAAARLSLSKPLRRSSGTVPSIWVSPGCWFLVSDTESADDLLDICTSELAGVTHLAVNFSDAMSIMKVSGSDAREVLSSGCSLDLRPARFPVGSACRTRFAQIAAFVIAASKDEFELLVDISYENYLAEWLADSAAIAALCAADFSEKTG